MISRKRCKAIARDWVIDQAIQECDRRLDSLDLQYTDHEELQKLHNLAAKMLLTGGYDPPTPKIPNMFQRLRINDWTPPEADWPMKTKGTWDPPEYMRSVKTSGELKGE